MSEAEERLARGLRALRPAARDPAFRLAVLERRARREMQVRLAGLAGGGVLVMGLVVAARPTLAAALGSLASHGELPLALLAASVAVIGWSVMRMRRPI